MIPFFSQIEMADVGPLLKIRVGHDGAGMFSGWFLDKVRSSVTMNCLSDLF